MSNGGVSRQQLRIAHVITSSDSIKLMDAQLRILKESGFDVHLVCSPGNELDRLLDKQAIKTFAIPMKREINPISDLISLWRLLWFMITVRPQLTNVSTPKAGLLAGIASWMARVPIRIYTLRGLRLETTYGWKRILLIATEKIACASAHWVICDSPSLRQRAISLGLVRDHKTIVLGVGCSNGLELDKFEYTAETEDQIRKIRSDYGIQHTDKVIGYVGRLTKDKGITELVRAFHMLKVNAALGVVKLLLVGYYEDADRLPTDVISIISSDPDIICTDYVDNPIPYYHLFDVFAFPTHREGFGNVSIEAAAAGKAVVTTNATGAIDTVMNGITGIIVDVGNEIQLANCLRDLLMDPEYAKQLGIKGKERVRREFSAERIGKELLSHYNEMIEVKIL